MARLSDRLLSNAPGDFYVDSSCIDCDLCRQLAPGTFVRDARAGQSIVGAQPLPADEERALMALVACPTASIGTRDRHDVRRAARRFPEELAPGVYFCGFASRDSYGASSYLIRRPGGNVLVDSPRANRTLFSRLDELGGVRFLFLTHRDDVADHAAFRERFGCQRILHRADLGHDTRDVEQILDGEEPITLADDLRAVPVPGHTRGSTALLHGARLFTGDHLWADEDAPGELDAGRGVCWYSWPSQIRSMERLRALSFTDVLPGHGRRVSASDPSAMRAALDRLIERMRG
jgi:glyoxylase-like metal-dependent hydrolase (beta-lactamase superfamily II)/ferredoxin